MGLGGDQVFKECWSVVKHPKEARAGEDSSRTGTGLGKSWVRLEKMTKRIWLELKVSQDRLVRDAGIRLWQDKEFGVYLVSKQRWGRESQVGQPEPAICQQQRKCCPPLHTPPPPGGKVFQLYCLLRNNGRGGGSLDQLREQVRWRGHRQPETVRVKCINKQGAEELKWAGAVQGK